MANLELRAAHESNIPWIAAMEGNPEFHSLVGHWTEDEHRHAMADPDVHYLIAQQADEDCGIAILRGLSSPHRNIELKRLVINRPEQGLGQRMLLQIMHFVFENLDAHRLWLDVFETNVRAQHVYRKLGFRDDGVIREAIYRDGVFHTLLLMSILDREFFLLQRADALLHAD